jgi:inner membrane protein
MQFISDLYFSHPFWVWLAVAAILLAIELPTGSGWLLWPAASAALMALLTLVGVRLGWGGEVVLFAAVSLAATLVSRRFMPKRRHDLPDINDRTGDLLGKTGLAVSAFNGGAGRVLVDGAEWDAEVEFGEAPQPGSKVEVVRVLGGARLAVRPV